MTSQQPPEWRPRKIDINLLPPEYMPRKASKLSIALVTLLVVLVCLILPLVFLKASVDDDSESLEARLGQLNIQLTELIAIEAQAIELQEQIAEAESQLEAMELDYQAFIDDLVYWSVIIEEIDDLIFGNRITLTSIRQSDSEVSLEGTATKRLYVYDYAVALEESDYFSGVDIEFGDCPEGEACTFTFTVPFSGEGGE